MLIQRLRLALATLIITVATALARAIAPPEPIARRLAGRELPEPEPEPTVTAPDLVDAIDRELRARDL